jgi:hypothetical protein
MGFTGSIVYRDYSGREGRDSCLFLLPTTTTNKFATAQQACTNAHRRAHLPTVASEDNTYVADNTVATPGNIQSQIIKLVNPNPPTGTNVVYAWSGASQPAGDFGFW